jgi:hypothetical protein|tara:strand:- start:383 stop:544 length:162 start_codon:yes stop_codon:yes gene_type:complete
LKKEIGLLYILTGRNKRDYVKNDNETYIKSTKPKQEKTSEQVQVSYYNEKATF